MDVDPDSDSSRWSGRAARAAAVLGALLVVVLGSGCSDSPGVDSSADPASANGAADGVPGLENLDEPGEDSGVRVALDPADSASSNPGASIPLLGGVRNLLVISLDTLRADRLTPYGYARPTSENLAAFAGRSFVFREARAQSSQTAPSHASLFTSEYPGAHGVINVHGHSPSIQRLPPGATTLAELLGASDIETAAFVSGGNLTRRMDMGRGFDVWDERLEDISDRIDAAVAWMLAPEREQGRFFAFVHSYQVHAPYLPPAQLVPSFVDPEYRGELRTRLEHYLSMSTADAWAAAVGPEYWAGLLDFTDEDVGFLSDLYDAEIAYADSQVRRLLSYVYQSGLGASTAVVVLSDHGEEFRDHGKFQHDQVFEEHLRVPLIIRLPPSLEQQGFKGGIDTPVSLVDVAPTLAELMGVDWSTVDWEGRSLLPLMRGERPGWADAPVFSELVVDPGPKTYRSVVWQGWKYIHAWQENNDHSWDWLFDLRADPGEQHNLFGSESKDAARAQAALQGQLAQYVAACQAKARQLGNAGVAPIDDEMRELMLQLGYVGEEQGLR